MLILEIALGIVLAVVILNYLPEIVGGGLVFLAVVAAAAVVLFLVFFVFTNSREILEFVFVIALMGLSIAGGLFLLVIIFGLIGMACLAIPGVRQFGERNVDKSFGLRPQSAGFNFLASIAAKIDVIKWDEIEAPSATMRWWLYICDRVALGIICSLSILMLAAASSLFWIAFGT